MEAILCYPFLPLYFQSSGSGIHACNEPKVYFEPGCTESACVTLVNLEEELREPSLDFICCTPFAFCVIPVIMTEVQMVMN